jgi:transglutaminase-like putative cysteine protease
MEGSCRDLAVLFCDVCGVMGIAARFVSGYECSSAGRSDSYMHAWTEVYLPGIGWRGYDPSRGIAVTNEHVAVAAAFDYDLANCRFVYRRIGVAHGCLDSDVDAEAGELAGRWTPA